jgi:ribosomal protein L11 methylase PrmA
VIQGGVESLRFDRQFDLILANLDANGLCELFRTISELFVPEGRAICSGILVSQAETVIAVARSFRLQAVAHRVEGEWLCLSLAAEGALQDR